MKSLRARLTVWFAASLVLVLAVFLAFTYRLLDTELHHKAWERDYPDHPDWKLHGSYSEAEVRDILAEFMETSVAYGLPLAGVALLIGYWLARKSVKPIVAVNEQLESIRAPDLSHRIQLPEVDREFRDLVNHINALLARLEKSFNDMSEYTAKVAHELRTPLAILRLKVEQAGGKIAPELAEELQAELHQLAHVVDQSLLIARAEQGLLQLTARPLDLAVLVADVAEDFSLLAQEEDRVLHLAVKSPCGVIADPKYARQIIHNLLANALKHGQGEVRVTLRRHGESYLLTITNRLRRQLGTPPPTLGLGLRVVDTLLTLHTGLKCRRRAGRTCYSTRLAFPAVSGEVALSPTREPMPAALDPGI